jgi:hypothetical protein
VGVLERKQWSKRDVEEESNGGFSTLYKLEWLPLTNISTKIGLAINNGGKY